MSQLTDSIQRQRAMDIKGHSGLPEIEKRDVMLDRGLPIRKAHIVVKDPKRLEKWLKS